MRTEIKDIIESVGLFEKGAEEVGWILEDVEVVILEWEQYYLNSNEVGNLVVLLDYYNHEFINVRLNLHNEIISTKVVEDEELYNYYKDLGFIA